MKFGRRRNLLSALIIGVSLILCIGIIAGGWFNSANKPSGQAPAPTGPTGPQKYFPPHEVLDAFLAQQSKLSLPAIKTVGTDGSKLPDGLGFLISASAENLQVRNITFVNGAQGFEATYSVVDTLESAHDKMWKTLWNNKCIALVGVYSQEVGLSEAKKDNNEIQIREIGGNGRVNYDVIILIP